MHTAVALGRASVAGTALDDFFDKLSVAPERVLLLDYDGTIAPFTATRNRAFPYVTIPEYLDCIMSTCRTRVVLISGRVAREIPPLLGLNPPPEIWGAHGMERLLPDGTYQVAAMPERTVQALADAQARVEECGLGALAEVKPGAVAIHWRGLDTAQAEAARTKAYQAFLTSLPEPDLRFAEFDGGVELRMRAPNKGNAVRAITSQHDLTTPIAYLGDDATDEEAFQALSGRGLTVLVRSTYRFTAAQEWLTPPGELVRFLAEWVRACGGDM